MSHSVWQQSRLRKQKQSNQRHKIYSLTGISMGEHVTTSTPSSGPMLGRSNLVCFLDHTTPSVQCQYPPKTSSADPVCEMGKFHSERMPSFNLGDLWSSFDEWSAYGAGVPLILPCGETIVQYYVPYLSALQIYLHPACSFLSNKRRLGDESDWSDVSDMRDASSDFGSDNENEKVPLRLQMKTDQWDSSSCVSSERLSSASSEQGDRQGDLVFEYFERCSPYGRAPFAGKISELSTGFSHLHSLRSNELSSTSWVSVAWYPIYRIPTGPTMSDLSTCFLTFHSLWTPPLLQDPAMQSKGSSTNHQRVIDSSDRGGDNGDYCSLDFDRSSSKQEPEQWLQDRSAWRIKSATTLELPTFGLASYKLRGPFWASAAPVDKQRASSLASSADSWLRQKVRAQHPDFDFFASREGTRSYR